MMAPWQVLLTTKKGREELGKAMAKSFSRGKPKPKKVKKP